MADLNIDSQDLTADTEKPDEVEESKSKATKKKRVYKKKAGGEE